MTLDSKNYLKILFSILITLMIMAVIYSYYFIKHYPIPITNRISLDAKITFIKENIDIDSVDTIIVGSSIGLNNVQGETLQKSSTQAKSVLNLSVYEATPPQIEQILQLTSTFPNLKRIIYSAQYSDFAYEGKLKEYNATFIGSYIKGSLSTKEKFAFYFKSCQNIFFCIKRAWNWRDKYQQNNQFTYLGFDATGSVPLHIYGDDIIASRWQKPHSNRQNNRTFDALDRMSLRAKNLNIDFIFALQPYRQPLIDKFSHVAPTMQKFTQKVKNIMSKNSGKFIDLHSKLHLKDAYFADRSHLNDKGSLLSSQALGEFLDK